MKLTYIKSFDGIRGVFCVMIIITHWKLAFPIVPFGWEALQVFFVLSGFLITRILLNDKNRVESFGHYAKVFYKRRSFRIFPLYFGYLLVWSLARASLPNSEFIQTQTAELEYSGVWMYTYLYNFASWFNFKAGIPYTDTPFFSALWSLSVEEQFYFFFPFLIYFLREKWLKVALVVLIVVPFLTRSLGFSYLLSVNDDPTWATLLIYRNIVFQFDSLALGAALAVFDLSWIRHPRRWFYSAFALLLACYIGNYWVVKGAFTHLETIPFSIFIDDGKINALGYLHLLGHPEILQFKQQILYQMPLVNITCFFMVLCSLREKPVFRKLFEHKWMVYLGQISYGMYVFHYCVMVFFLKGARAVIPSALQDGQYLVHFILFFLYLGMVIFVSHLSFTYFESFFIRLKNKVRV